jgi:protein ImuA
MSSRADLRALIAARAETAWGSIALCPGIELGRGRMHELLAGESEASVGFAAALLSRFTGVTGAALWCGRTNHPNAPGLAAFGVDPNRLIFARTATDIQTLWAMEEGLRCPDLSVVAGAVSSLDLTEGRRLQLAAERHGVAALVLRRSHRWGEAELASSAAATRWKVTPLPSPRDGMTQARWRVERLRCRGAMPGEFIVRWSHAAGGIAVAAEAGDGYSAAARSDAA